MIITLDPDPPPKKWGTTHEKILWFRISLKHLGAKKKNNRKSDNLLEFRRIFLFLNYKFQLLCLQIMKSCLSKCCFPPAYELPKSLLIICSKSKNMWCGIAPHFPIIYNCARFFKEILNHKIFSCEVPHFLRGGSGSKVIIITFIGNLP